MQSALRTTTRVLPGGRVELTDPQLPAGEVVDVIVLLSSTLTGSRPSVVDVLDSAPGGLLFRSAAEVDDYLREERDAWDR